MGSISRLQTALMKIIYYFVFRVGGPIQAGN